MIGPVQELFYHEHESENPKLKNVSDCGHRGNFKAEVVLKIRKKAAFRL